MLFEKRQEVLSLQGWQAGTRFVQVCSPPRNTDTTWSRVIFSSEPQYTHRRSE